MLLTLAAYLLSLLSIFQFLLVRESRFSAYSFSRIAFAVGITAFQLGLFYAQAESGLISGYLLGAALTVLCLVLLLKKPAFFDFSFSQLKKVITRYYPITKWSLPGSLLNASANNLQPFLIGLAFSSRDAGIFFLAYKLVGTPLNLVTNSISQVFFKEATTYLQHGEPEKLEKLVWNISIAMAALLGFSFFLFFLLGDGFFISLFGPQWSGSALFVLWLVPYFLGKGLFNPVSSLAEALNKTKWEFLFSFFSFSMLILGVFLGLFYQSLKVFILFFSCTTGLGYLMLWLFFYEIIKTGKYEPRL